MAESHTVPTKGQRAQIQDNEQPSRAGSKPGEKAENERCSDIDIGQGETQRALPSVCKRRGQYFPEQNLRGHR
jgi:hypothetical protein